jgi:hypothetical protein
MTEQHLNGPQIYPVFDQMGRETMAQSVATNPAVRLGPTAGGVDCPGEEAGVDVKAPDVAGLWIAGAALVGEDELPAEVLGGTRKLAGQSER